MIEELGYPLTFDSLDKTYAFGRNASWSGTLSDLSSQEIVDWIIAGWYYIVRRMEELAMRFGFIFNMAALRHIDVLGICCCKEKVIVLCPGLLRQPPIVVDSVLVHELCHLKYPHHGGNFWKLNQDIARELGYKTNFSYDFGDEYLIDYGHPFPQGIDVCRIINKTLEKMYDLLSHKQRKQLPLQKIPL